MSFRQSLKKFISCGIIRLDKRPPTSDLVFRPTTSGRVNTRHMIYQLVIRQRNAIPSWFHFRRVSLFLFLLGCTILL
jgi:hypothetical protein